VSRRIGSGYVVHEIIGRGASGTVWRGDGPDGPVAVKVLRPELAGDEQIVVRFVRERRLLTRLRHPHLVAVRDLVAEGDTLALVFDLVDGPSLRARLDNAGPLSPAEAADTVAWVAEALLVVHAAGVVHRDVKPENVLLASDARAPRPMLTDFGVALLTGDGRMTDAGGVVGTAEYLAPESASGLPPTPAADIYAAGVLLYELLCGRTPFGAPHPAAVIHRHVYEEPEPIDGAPEALWAIISRCLAKQPADRPDAAELARVLRAAAAGLPDHAAPARPLVHAAPSDTESATHLGRRPAKVPAPAAVRRRRWRWRSRYAIAGLAVLALAGATTARAIRDEGPLVYRAATGWLCPEWLAEPDVPSLRPCVLARGGVVAAAAHARLPAGAPPVQVEVHLVRAGEPGTVVASGRCRLSAAAGATSGCGQLRHPLDGERYFAVAVIVGRLGTAVASPIVAR